MDVCRFCSSEEELLDVFQQMNGPQLRLSTFLATGIQIDETDIVSKMVCRRCCDIAMKLHKYRVNAIANDKLLKIQCGQSYTSPVVNQEEILRIAARMASEYMILAYKKSKSATEDLHLKNESLYQSYTKYTLETEKSIIPVEPSTEQNLQESKSIVMHSSVRKLYQQSKNIILPTQVLNSDISPVILLSTTDVRDWYTEQTNKLQKKLKSIKIRRISTSSGVSYVIDNSDYSRDPKVSEVDTSYSEGSRLESSYQNTNGNIKQNEKVNYPVKKSAICKKKRKKFKRLLFSKSQIFEDDEEEVIPQKKIRGFYNIQPKYVPNEESKKAKRLLFSRSQLFEDDEDEVIPQKKIRGFYNIQPRSDPNEADLAKHVLYDDDQLSLELASDSLSSMDMVSVNPLQLSNSESTSTVSTLTPSSIISNNSTPTFKYSSALSDQVIFTCPVCGKLFLTRKQLTKHQVSHFSCKWCKIRFKSEELLNQHINEACFLKIVNNPPNIRLIRIDSVQSVVERYPNCFEYLLPQEIVDIVDANNKSTTMVLSNGTRTLVNGVEQSKTLEIEVICLLDESDDEEENVNISKHSFLNNAHLDVNDDSYGIIRNLTTNEDNQNKNFKCSSINSPLTRPNHIQNTPIHRSKMASIFPNHMHEVEMIRLSFKRYYNNSKSQSCSHTDSIPKNKIVCTNTNLIILYNLIFELSKHNIPVHFLKYQQRLLAEFQVQLLPVQELVLENWKNKRVIGVQNLSEPYIRNMPKVNSNPINNENQSPGLLYEYNRSASFETKPQVISKPIVKTDFTSNIIAQTQKNDMLTNEPNLVVPSFARLSSTNTNTKDQMNYSSAPPDYSIKRNYLETTDALSTTPSQVLTSPNNSTSSSNKFSFLIHKEHSYSTPLINTSPFQTKQSPASKSIYTVNSVGSNIELIPSNITKTNCTNRFESTTTNGNIHYIKQNTDPTRTFLIDANSLNHPRFLPISRPPTNSNYDMVLQPSSTVPINTQPAIFSSPSLSQCTQALDTSNTKPYPTLISQNNEQNITEINAGSNITNLK